MLTTLKGIKSRLSSQSGFTIVELLVVIVVIGILASITIVSYNGITARANVTSAQSSARAVTQKIEIYNAEIGRYPYSTADLTGDSTKSYYLSSTSVSFALTTTQPTSPNTVKFIKCGTTPNSAQADIISSANNLTGARLYYWDYVNNNANTFIPVGSDTGSGIACPLT